MYGLSAPFPDSAALSYTWWVQLPQGGSIYHCEIRTLGSIFDCGKLTPGAYFHRVSFQYGKLTPGTYFHRVSFQYDTGT